MKPTRRFLDNDTENDNKRLYYIHLEIQYHVKMTAPAPVGHCLEKDWAVDEDTELEDHRLEENMQLGSLRRNQLWNLL